MTRTPLSRRRRNLLTEVYIAVDSGVCPPRTTTDTDSYSPMTSPLW